MKKVYLPLLLVGLLLSFSIAVSAQQSIDQQKVNEKYEEISSLATLNERKAFVGNLNHEMRAALWRENIIRKTNGMNLTEEQREIADAVRRVFTAEFAEKTSGPNPEGYPGFVEFESLMKRAKEAFTRGVGRELFYILGDSKTLKQ